MDYFKAFPINTLGLNLVGDNSHNTSAINSFGKYCSLLFETIFSSLYTSSLDTANYNICDIKIPSTIKNFDIYRLQFILNSDVIDELMNIGYDSLSRFCEQKSD